MDSAETPMGLLMAREVRAARRQANTIGAVCVTLVLCVLGALWKLHTLDLFLLVSFLIPLVATTTVAAIVACVWLVMRRLNQISASGMIPALRLVPGLPSPLLPAWLQEGTAIYSRAYWSAITFGLMPPAWLAAATLLLAFSNDFADAAFALIPLIIGAPMLHFVSLHIMRSTATGIIAICLGLDDLDAARLARGKGEAVAGLTDEAWEAGFTAGSVMQGVAILGRALLVRTMLLGGAIVLGIAGILSLDHLLGFPPPRLRSAAPIIALGVVIVLIGMGRLILTRAQTQIERWICARLARGQGV